MTWPTFWLVFRLSATLSLAGMTATLLLTPWPPTPNSVRRWWRERFTAMAVTLVGLACVLFSVAAAEHALVRRMAPTAHAPLPFRLMTFALVALGLAQLALAWRIARAGWRRPWFTERR